MEIDYQSLYKCENSGFDKTYKHVKEMRENSKYK